MKEQNVYDAVTDVREDYLDRANDPGAAAADGKKRTFYALRTLAAVVCCLVAVGAAVVHFALPHFERKTQPVPSQDVSGQNAPASVAIVPFPANTDPGEDAYGEEELPLVRVSVNGIEYDQIEPERLADFSVPAAVPAESFGDALGAVAETDGDDMPETLPPVWSKEPSLRGAQAYLYAPAGTRAAVLVRSAGRCGFFACTGLPSRDGACLPFDEVFRFYSPEGADGLAAIDYAVDVPDGSGAIRTARSGSITEKDAIGSFADVLCSLTPELANADRLAGSPAWFNEGMDAYRAAPESFNARWIRLTFRFTNGMRLEETEFIPFVGDGYFTGMAQLTKAQTAKLLELLHESA